MHIALLAAGASRRMAGRDKLVEPVGGMPLLRRLAMAALASGAGPVAVTLAPDHPDRRKALEGLEVAQLPVADASRGMSASLRRAAAWASGHPLMICPGDMPEITADDFATIAAAYAGQPLRATDESGKWGHPVVFPPRLLGLFAGLAGDDGARSLLQRHPPAAVALPGRHATTDLDTPQDWAAWRRETGL